MGNSQSGRRFRDALTGRRPDRRQGRGEGERVADNGGESQAYNPGTDEIRRLSGSAGDHRREARRQALEEQRQERVEDMERVQYCLQHNVEDPGAMLSSLQLEDHEALVVRYEQDRGIHGDNPILDQRHQKAVQEMDTRHRRQKALLAVAWERPRRYSEVSGPPPSYPPSSRRPSAAQSFLDQPLRGTPEEPEG